MHTRLVIEPCKGMIFLESTPANSLNSRAVLNMWRIWSAITQQFTHGAPSLAGLPS